MDEGTPEAPPPELRAVNPAYKGKNGFEPKFTDSVDPNDKHAMRVALDRHRLTERIIATKGRPIPSFEEMQKFVERIKTPATVRESIKELQEEHLEDLQALYDYQAADYIQDTRDFYASWDDTVYLEEGEQDQRIIESYRRLEVRRAEVTMPLPLSHTSPRACLRDIKKASLLTLLSWMNTLR
ncbi:hypothetical protein NMY22_g15696 [Coprinellus aureogranulatus]|nr:hypothetical protein NMY22_g15696 [Coprinellus aureogranulatus]